MVFLTCIYVHLKDGISKQIATKINANKKVDHKGKGITSDYIQLTAESTRDKNDTCKQS